MEKNVQEFVTGNLSRASSHYILNGWYNDNGKIELKMLSMSRPRNNVFMIGDLSQSELELYIIMESLLSRMNATYKRLQETNYTCNNDWLIESRCARLVELSSDWRETRNLLYETIEKRLEKEIEKVALDHSDYLIRKRFDWTNMDHSSGYVFVFFAEKKIGITNRYPAPGD